MVDRAGAGRAAGMTSGQVSVSAPAPERIEGIDAPSARSTAETLEIGALLAIVGGFLDAYTYLTCGGVFANAQSGNVVLLGVEAVHGNYAQALRHLFPILAFIAGVVLVETLRCRRVAALVRCPARAALLLEVAVLIAVGLLPGVLARDVVVVLIAFVAAVQIATFRTLRGWLYTTTMVTGNLMAMTSGIFGRLVIRDREATAKAINFTAITVSFLVGAVLGGAFCLLLGSRAIWIPAVTLLAALSLFVFDGRFGHRSMDREADRQPR
ncbi:YoaK family protein [Nocardia sp. NPDC127526]|uniref:YoaK family protein n=1 Tax=Nocardia sp. NPDC127526 TaxID=3345393 RepID=UPI003631C8E9